MIYRTFTGDQIRLDPSADRPITGEVRVLMIEQFAQHQRYRGLSEKTIQRRTETLAQLVRFMHPLPITSATYNHLEHWLGTKVQPRTRKAYRSDLRVFYAWAFDIGLIGENPAERLASVRVPKTLPRPIDRIAAMSLLWSGSLKVRRMCALAMFAGLREFEIAQLDASDVWRQGRPPVVVVRDGKGRKDRSVPMHPTLVDLFDGIPSAGPLFPGRVDVHVRPQSVGVAMTAHMRRAGIVGTPHQLRHSFGTELAAVSGGDMVLVAEYMGHESMTTTMGYVRLVRSGGSEIVGRMFGEDDVA